MPPRPYTNRELDEKFSDLNRRLFHDEDVYSQCGRLTGCNRAEGPDPLCPSAFIVLIRLGIMQNAHSFERYLIVSKGLQPITVKGYVGAADRFTRVVGENPSHKRVEGFVFELYTSNYSYSHKLNTVLAIEQYMAFIENPIKLGRQKKPRPMVKDTLTEAEVTRLLFNTRNVREHAILCILAYSGIRNQEICNLRVKDFSIPENVIRIYRGKGIKDGVSEVTPECSRSVMEYLAAFPRTADDLLFTTLVRGNQLCTQDVRKLVKVVAKRARMTKRVYPHLFRHSMTANMILRGADIVSLRNQLRHTLLETTLHYANSIVFVERNQYQKFAPSYI